MLGGAVLALRLMFDNFRLDAVVNLIGQLPREFVITAGFVEAVAPALVVGLLATARICVSGRATALTGF